MLLYKLILHQLFPHIAPLLVLDTADSLEHQVSLAKHHASLIQNPIDDLGRAHLDLIAPDLLLIPGGHLVADLQDLGFVNEVVSGTLPETYNVEGGL